MPSHWPYTCPWCRKPIINDILDDADPHYLISGPLTFHNDWRGGWHGNECGLMLTAHVAVNKATYELEKFGYCCSEGRKQGYGHPYSDACAARNLLTQIAQADEAWELLPSPDWLEEARALAARLDPPTPVAPVPVGVGASEAVSLF